jgi:hypothetical protein
VPLARYLPDHLLRVRAVALIFVMMQVTGSQPTDSELKTLAAASPSTIGVASAASGLEQGYDVRNGELRACSDRVCATSGRF